MIIFVKTTGIHLLNIYGKMQEQKVGTQSTVTATVEIELPGTRPQASYPHGVATFSFARGAISSPSIPGSLPAAPRPSNTSSHFFAGPCAMSKVTSINKKL